MGRYARPVPQDRCPNCGGSSFQPEARGYLRCISVIVVGLRPPPGAPPWLPLPPVPVEGICGHRFRSPSWLRRRAQLLVDEPGGLAG
jgi:hypothetical protein